MNTCHLTKADLTKALADAAAFNEQHAVDITMAIIRANPSKRVIERLEIKIKVHEDFAARLRGECRRLQKGGV